MPDYVKQIIDSPAVNSQLKVLIGGLTEAKNLIDKINASPIGKAASGAGLKDQTALTEKLRKENEKLIAVQQKLVDSEEKLKVVMAQRSAAIEKAAAAEIIAKEKVKQAQIATTAAEERAANATVASSKRIQQERVNEQKITAYVTNEYKQLREAVRQAEERYASLFLTMGKGHYLTLQAQQDALRLKNVLNEVQTNTKNYSGNVGNYPGGMGGGGMGGDGGDGGKKGPGDGLMGFGGDDSSVKGLRKTFGFLRYTAYVLPGLGIAGIFNLIIEGVTKAITSLLSFNSQLYVMIEREAGIASVVNKINELAKSTRELRKELTLGQETKYLKETIQYYETMGFSLGKILEKRLELARLEAREAVKDLGISGKKKSVEDNYARQLAIVGQAGERIQQLNSQERDIVNEPNFAAGKNQEVYMERLELVRNLKSAMQSYYDDQLKILNNYDDTRKESYRAEVELQQWREEQARKLILETIKIEETANKRKNEMILNDDRSTLEQRLRALSANLAAERRIADADLAYTLSRPDAKNSDGSYTTESLVAIKENGDKKISYMQDYNQKAFKVRDEYNQRMLEYNSQEREGMLQAQIEFNEEKLSYIKDDYEKQGELVSQNTNLLLQLEEEAYRLSLEKKAAIIIQAQRGDATAKKELRLMEQDHYMKLASIRTSGELELYKISEQAAQKLIDAQSASFEGTVKSEQNASSVQQLYALQDLIVAYEQLASALKEGTISYDDFLKARDELQKSYEKDNIKIQIEGLEKVRDLLKESGKSILAIDLQIANLRKSLIDKGVNDVEKAEQKKLEIKRRFSGLEYDLARATVELITNIVQKGYIDQQNEIQKKIDLNTKATNLEIENINNLSVSEIEKAALITVAKETSIARENELIIQQNEIKYRQAQFEQQAALFNIGIKTAEAIAQTKLQASILGANPLTLALVPMALAQIPIQIGIGLVQAAAVLAKGIPRFELGTDSAPGGLALTDEKGAELYINKDGSMFVGSNDGPNYKNLEKGTKVIPAHKKDAFLMDNMISSLNKTSAPKDRELPDAINRQTRTLVKELRNSRPVITNKVKIDLARENYKNNLRY